MTHICVGNLTIIGSDNGLSPGRRQALTWTNAGILLIRTLGTNFSEILGEIHSFSFSKMHLKMSSAKWRLFVLGLNELMQNLSYLPQFHRWVVSRPAVSRTSQVAWCQWDPTMTTTGASHLHEANCVLTADTGPLQPRWSALSLTPPPWKIRTVHYSNAIWPVWPVSRLFVYGLKTNNHASLN